MTQKMDNLATDGSKIPEKKNALGGELNVFMKLAPSHFLSWTWFFTIFVFVFNVLFTIFLVFASPFIVGINQLLARKTIKHKKLTDPNYGRFQWVWAGITIIISILMALLFGLFLAQPLSAMN